jgi:pimeloyl-ACP methyl ester carboxylesterase
MSRIPRRIFAVLALAAGLLLAGVGAFAALNWEPDRPVGALAQRYAPPPSRLQALDGMQVHLRDEGPREDPLPVVLLHGTSSSLHTWEGWAAGLSRERRVVSMDLPGFGLTGPSPDGDYSIARYVRFLAALLDALGVRRCVLAGNSLGGEIAWQFALAQPQRVERLVLVDAAGYAFESESVPLGFRVARTPGLRWLAGHVLPRSVIESSLRNVYGDPTRVTPALVQRHFELALREGDRDALGRRFASLERGASAARIAQLRLPTLILWGGRDRLIPPAWGERFARDIPGSRLVVFDALGHVPHEEDPAATLRALREFIGAPG